MKRNMFALAIVLLGSLLCGGCAIGVAYRPAPPPMVVTEPDGTQYYYYYYEPDGRQVYYYYEGGVPVYFFFNAGVRVWYHPVRPFYGPVYRFDHRGFPGGGFRGGYHRGR